MVDLAHVKDYLVFALLLAALYFAGRELDLFGAFETQLELPAPAVAREAARPEAQAGQAAHAAQAVATLPLDEQQWLAQAGVATGQGMPTRPVAAPVAGARAAQLAAAQAASKSARAQAGELGVQAQLLAASADGAGTRSGTHTRALADGQEPAPRHPARRARTPDSVFAARYRGSAPSELALVATELEQQLLREQTLAFDRCFAAGEFDVQVISTPRGEQQLLSAASDEPLHRVQAFSEGDATGVRIARLPFAQYPQIYALVDELDWLRRESRRVARR